MVDNIENNNNAQNLSKNVTFPLFVTQGEFYCVKLFFSPHIAQWYKQWEKNRPSIYGGPFTLYVTVCISKLHENYISFIFFFFENVKTCVVNIVSNICRKSVCTFISYPNIFFFSTFYSAKSQLHTLWYCTDTLCSNY